MDIRFGDHSSFHRAAIGMVGGAALFGLTLHPVLPQAPLVGGILGLAAGAAIGYGKWAWRAVAAAAASVPLIAMAPSWPALALVASATGLGLAVGGPRGVRGAIAVMFGAVATLVAMWTALRFDHARQTMTWPGWATDTASAAAMGIVGVLAMLPRHVRIALDPIASALRGLPHDLEAEVQGLCDRSVAIWTSAKDRLDAGDPGRALVRDGVLKTLEVARKSAEVKAGGASDAELAQRMADLDQRIEGATDPEIKSQYQSARAALDDQRRYRDKIRHNRERMIARMHNHVAALEKFQLAASGLEAARAASTSAPAVKQLDELSADVAASGEALADLELGT
jgi:hypothetical protein